MALPVSIVGLLCTEIRENIFRGKYKPGMVLRQEEIAQQFDVSRVPLREAFSKLEAEGYLCLRPRRGYAVSSFNPEEIAEIFDLRLVLESHAGQVATKNRTMADVADLRAVVDQMTALDKESPNYVDTWCDLNRTFHERLVKSCARPRLLKLTLHLRDLVEPYIRIESRITGHLRDADLEHVEIVAAFEAGNSDLVAALSAAHCGRTASRLLKSLVKTPSNNVAA